MDKPLALKIQEFQKAMTSVIEQSGLPIYILKYQIKDLLAEIEKLENDFAQKELQEYYQSQQQTAEESPKEEAPSE